MGYRVCIVDSRSTLVIANAVAMRWILTDYGLGESVTLAREFTLRLQVTLRLG